jgi:hypothetical protein
MAYGESAPQMMSGITQTPRGLESIESIVVEQLVVDYITSEAK